VIVADLRAAGFDAQPVIEQVQHMSRSATPVEVAAAFLGGTPLRDQVEERGPGLLADAIAATSSALAERFGASDLQSRMSAQFIIADR
jgi:hypothetical protein